MPTIQAELGAGRSGEGGLRIVAAWIAHLRGHGAPVSDSGSVDTAALVAGSEDAAITRVLEWLGISDSSAHETVRNLLQDILSREVSG